MVRFHMDDSELRNLEIDLSLAPRRVQLAAPRVLRTVVGPRLEKEMKRDARGHRFLPRLARAVSWEMLDEWQVEAGISPRPSGRQGRLAHIIVYGSVNNGPVYDHTAALRRTEPAAVRALADAAEESVLGDD